MNAKTHRIRILLAEDELVTAKSLQFDLEDLGFEVLGPVIQAEDIIKTALAEKPDFILMDIRLKGKMNTAQAVEKLYERSKIPILFMTGYPLAMMREELSRFNPIAIFEKPVLCDSIAKAIHAHLDGSKS